MVVPSVRIVVGEENGGAAPQRRLLKLVKGSHDKELFIQWRRVASVAVLGSLGLQETHVRELTYCEHVKEVRQVILVVGLIRPPDHLS